MLHERKGSNVPNLKQSKKFYSIASTGFFILFSRKLYQNLKQVYFVSYVGFFKG